MAKKKLSEFLKNTNTSYIFTGEKCEVYVPQRYSVHDLLMIENEVRTLGIFEIHVKEKDIDHQFNYLLPAILTMCPSSTYRQKINGREYWVLVFEQGDVFIKNKTLIKQGFIITAMFKEFVVNGNFPSFLSYQQLATLFDKAQETCGVDLRVPHPIFELIYAHLARDQHDLTRPYRYTDQLEPPHLIGVKNVAYATSSTTARIIGSYMNIGMNAAIINPAQKQSPIEDMLRS